MRIGIITGEYPPMQGGVGAYTQVLARTLISQGHEVFILTSKEGDSRDVQIQVFPEIDSWSMRSLNHIRKWIDVNHIRVVNIQFQTAAYGMSPWIHFLPNRLNIPVVTTFHDLRFPYLFPKAGRLRTWIVEHLARASAGVIVTNHEDYDRVQDLEHVKLVPIGSNILATPPSDFIREEWRENLGIVHNRRQRDLLVGFFGFMNHSKGIDILLQAVADLRDSGLPIKLVIVGGKTGSSDPTNIDYAKQVEQVIDDLNLREHINWTGFVTDDEVSAYLRACDVVALPFRDGASFRRGSLMAAIQNNCAIVTTQPSVEIPEFVSKKNMLLVERENVMSLTGALALIYSSPNLASKLQLGAKELKFKFNWNNIARDTVRLFDEVIGE